MIADSTSIAGIVIPSDDPFFLGIVAVHVVAAIVCVIAGAGAMLSDKQRGRHTQYGRVYFWTLAVVTASMAMLAVARWHQDYHLFLIGCASFGLAVVARQSIRDSGGRRVRVHIASTGSSYVLLLVAFYVDNGPHLPFWRDIPPVLHWLLPVVIGGGLIVRALWRHPLARAEKVSSARTNTRQ